MEIRDRRGLKDNAGQTLAQVSGDPGKLVLIHTGLTQLISLVLAVVDYYLEQQIGSTGGLGGLGTRSVLETVQSVLSLAWPVVLPLWQVGYLFAALKMARGYHVNTGDLVAGFHCFFPMLRLLLIQGMLYVAIAIVVCYPASILFMLSPWAGSLYSEEFMTAQTLDTEAMMKAMMSAEVLVPMICIFAVLYLAVLIPVFYRMRMAQYCLLDEPQMGAMAAIRKSFQMMKGNAGAMVKLDLSFWWYYVLGGLAAVVTYLDVLLPVLGVELPWSGAVCYFGAFILGGICQILLHWRWKNQVEVTYAHAYEILNQPREEKPVIIEAGNVSWNSDNDPTL